MKGAGMFTWVVTGSSCSTIGRPVAAATMRKYSATTSRFLRPAGGATISASAPCSRAMRANAAARCVPEAETPTATGTRPRVSLTTVSTTRRRSSSVRRCASPAMPRMVRPLTPVASADSIRRGRPATSSAPSSRKGVARMWKMPDHLIMIEVASRLSPSNSRHRAPHHRAPAARPRGERETRRGPGRRPSGRGRSPSAPARSRSRRGSGSGSGCGSGSPTAA